MFSVLGQDPVYLHLLPVLKSLVNWNCVFNKYPLIGRTHSDLKIIILNFNAAQGQFRKYC